MAAFWVLWGHLGGLPFSDGIDKTSQMGRAVAASYGLMISGQAAVIVFFILSGYCIHWPAAHQQPASWRSFFVRRVLRIGVPMLAILPFLEWSKIDFHAFNDSIYWSLICEMVYYCLYPALLFLSRRMGWWKMIWFGLLMCVIINLLLPIEGSNRLFQRCGPCFTWLLGLPCWMLGAQLAEIQPTTQQVFHVLWRWRLAIWLVSFVLNIATFHSPFSHSLTLGFFGLFTFYWLRIEIARWRLCMPSAITGIFEVFRGYHR